MENREIKFRAWDGKCFVSEEKYATIGLTLEGDAVSMNNDSCETGWQYRDNLILSQYTGLKDKNGKEIYEGDIVECYDHPTEEESGTFEIWFSNGAFLCRGSSLLLRDFGTAWTNIVGNIYENPELKSHKKSHKIDP